VCLGIVVRIAVGLRLIAVRLGHVLGLMKRLRMGLLLNLVRYELGLKAGRVCGLGSRAVLAFRLIMGLELGLLVRIKVELTAGLAV
jgi:hypothetical protein